MAMTSVTDYFRDYAPRYDSFALRAMPRYEEMLNEVVRYLPEHAERILELGCGTGALTALLVRHYPNSEIIASDGSPEMIEQARKRLGSWAVPHKQVTFAQSLFEEMDLPEHGYDLITSNMSLHHVAEKGPLYARVQAALRPGCLLVLGDELRGALPFVHQLHWDRWLQFARQAGGVTEKELEEITQHEREFDHYETLPRQLELLHEAGFASADCVWRYLNYAIFVARA
jgi:tRNA (cmo5U34)-methyltransferase